MDRMKRLLLVLLCLNPLMLRCMSPHDDLPPTCKCPRVEAVDSLKPRSSANLLIINQGGRRSGDLFTLDNGAIPTSLSSALRSERSVVLLEKMTMIPLLLFSQYKSLPVVQKSYDDSEPDYALLCNEFMRHLTFLRARERSWTQRLDALHEIKNSLAHLDCFQMRKLFSDVRFSERDLLAAWINFAYGVKFDRFDIVFFDSSDFVLLVPRDYIFSVGGMPEGERHVFSDTDQLLSKCTSTAGDSGVAVHDIVAKIFAAESSYRWNVFFFGHGSESREACPVIAGMHDSCFLETIDFLNERFGNKINVLCWLTCYGGGGRTEQVLERLRAKNARQPACCHIIALNPFNAIFGVGNSPTIFRAIDELFRSNTSNVSPELFEKFLKIIGQQMHIGQVALLAPDSDKFEIVNTDSTFSAEQVGKTNRVIQATLTRAGVISSTDLEAFAKTRAILDTKALKVLIVALSMGGMNAGEIFLTSAIASENVYALVNAARVSIDVHGVPMSETFARDANNTLSLARALADCLSPDQRTDLMRIAARSGYINLVVALLGVAVPFDGLVSAELAQKMCELSELPFACAMGALTSEQRDAFAKQEKTIDAQKLHFALLYANPSSGRITQLQVKFIERKISSADLPTVVDSLCMARADEWLRQAVNAKATSLILCLLNRGVQLSAASLPDDEDKLFQLLCALCQADFDACNRVVCVLNEAQRLVVGRKLKKMFSDDLHCAWTVLQGRIWLALQVFAAAACDSLSVDIDVSKPSSIPRYSEGIPVYKTLLSALAEMFHHMQIFIDAYMHMTLQQREALRASLSNASRLALKGVFLSRAEKLKAFFDVVEHFDDGLKKWNAVRAEIINELPHEYISRLLDASSEEVRGKWCKSLGSAEREQYQNLRRIISARRGAWCLLEHDPLPMVLLHCLSNEASREYAASVEMDVEVAFALEDALDETLCDDMRRIDVPAIMKVLNDKQRCALANIAALFELARLRDMLHAVGVVVPTHDAAVFESSLLPSLAFACLVPNLKTEREKNCHSRALERYRRLTITQRLQVADCALSPDDLPSGWRLYFAGAANKNLPITVEIVCLLNNPQQPVKDFFDARTPDQVQKIEAVAQFLKLDNLLMHLKSLGRSSPSLHEMPVNEELARALNKLNMNQIIGVISEISPAQKLHLCALSKTAKLWRVCVGLLVSGGDSDMKDLPVSVGLVEALKPLKLDVCGVTVREKLSVDQLQAIMRVASLLNFKELAHLLGGDCQASDTIEIDENVTRCLADISPVFVEELLKRCTATQRDQLFGHAQRMNLENLLLCLATFDALRFPLSRDVDFSKLRHIENHFIRARIIAALSDQQRTTLAALAQVCNWRYFKKHLFIQQVPLPEVHAIDIDVAFVRSLNDVKLTPAIFAQFCPEQLALLRHCAQTHGLNNVLSVLDQRTSI